MQENWENHTTFTTHPWCTLANKISSEERGFWSLSNSFCLHTFRRVQFWRWTCVLCIIQSNSAERALKFITVLGGGERRRHIVVHNIKRGCSSKKHTEAKHDRQFYTDNEGKFHEIPVWWASHDLVAFCTVGLNRELKCPASWQTGLGRQERRGVLKKKKRQNFVASEYRSHREPDFFKISKAWIFQNKI